jgi:hypothetical protein
MASQDEKIPKIMSKPLPQILDELEEYIAQVADAVKASQVAADESKQSALDAKAAGEEAAMAARKAAEAAVAKVSSAMENAMDEIRDRIERVKKTADTALKLAQVTNAGIVASVEAYNREIENL